MSWKNVRLIFCREFRDQLRDRRTLFTIAVLPMLLYPLLGMSIAQIAQFRQEHPTRVRILGAGHLPSSPKLIEGDRFANGLIDEEAARLLELTVADSVTGVVDAEQARDVAERDIQKSRYDAIVYFPPRFSERIEQFRQQILAVREAHDSPAEAAAHAQHIDVPQPAIFSNAANDKSVLAANRVERVLRAWREQVVQEGFKASNIPVAAAKPFSFTLTDISQEYSRRAAFWSKLLPFVVLVWALTGAFYPAVDLCAGEKERGTLETLLSSPAARSEIVWGKLLTVTLFSIATSLLNLSSMCLTGVLFFRQLGQSGMQVGAPPALAVAWLIVALIPIAALFSALSLAIAAFARSSKEGQYYLMPLLLISLPLMMLPMMPATQLDLGTSLIPVTGMMLLLQALVEGHYSEALNFAVPVLAVTAVCCLLAIRWAIGQFQNESVLFRESERFSMGLWLRQLVRDRGATPSFGEAILCGLLLLMIRFFAGSFAGMPQNWSGFVVMTLVTLIAYIATPALLMAIVLTRSPRQTLLLKLPSLSAAVMAILLAFAFHPLALLLAEGIKRLYPVGDQISAQLGQLGTILDQSPGLWSLLLVMALAPAICEELAFRGFILSGLKQAGNKWVAITISSLFFGAAHGILQQSLAACIVGMLIGYIAVQTSSLLPCILFHLVYNSLSISIGLALPEVVDTQPWLLIFFEETAAGLMYHPLFVVAGAILSVAVIFWFHSLPQTRSGSASAEAELARPVARQPLAS